VRPSAAPCLNLRPQPLATSVPLDCLSIGTPVTALDGVPFWRRVRLGDGREGWAAKKFLEPADTVAIADAPPDSSAIPDSAWLEVHFVDVGQGDAIWIRTHDDGLQGNGIYEGKNIVIDGGPRASAGEKTLRDYIEIHGHHGAVIDALIVTHPHDDHFPGAEVVLRHFDVASYYDPGFPKQGTAYPAFLAAVKQERAEERPIALHIGRASFAEPAWGRELTVEFLYSYPDSSAGLGSGSTLENNASIVLKLTYGAHSFLFMGDAEGKERDGSVDEPKYVEGVLLAEYPAERLKATVLKLAHHGSETSSTLPFMAAVNPEVIIASSGRRKYGPHYLPDASVLARYCALNPVMRVYRTDQDDARKHRTTADDADGDHVVVRTNGTTLEATALRDGALMTPPAC
jgi:competence protein ComEC